MEEKKVFFVELECLRPGVPPVLFRGYLIESDQAEAERVTGRWCEAKAASYAGESFVRACCFFHSLADVLANLECLGGMEDIGHFFRKRSRRRRSAPKSYGVASFERQMATFFAGEAEVECGRV